MTNEEIELLQQNYEKLVLQYNILDSNYKELCKSLADNKDDALDIAIKKLSNELSQINSNNSKITIKDFYSAMAMCGMLSFGDTRSRSGAYLSRKSFEIAEAMLEAR